MKYGKWTVITHDGRYCDCECECGAAVKVRTTALVNGRSTQCKSCSSREKGRKGLNAQVKQHLYMISTGPYVKIGSTDDITTRFRKIQLGCPYPVTLEYVGMDEGFLESTFHEIFADCKLEGEWFKI